MARFVKEKLESSDIEKLKELQRLARGDILKMTTLARSGHPGGALSSLDIFLILYSFANVNPKNPRDPDRDRIVVSHGHTSAGVYAVLGRLGFFDIDEAIAGFRKAGTLFEGHVERKVPGVEWDTGNLGQGLSAGCGFALAAKLLGKDFHVFVAMSDAEQAKGQVAEARRFARKYGLNNITVVIDYNRKQISGNTFDVMPVNIKENYLSDGWEVIEVNGHDFQELYLAMRNSLSLDSPVAILAYTTMGKGISFMEDKEKYHGKPLTEEELQKALEELGLPNDIDRYKKLREKVRPAKRFSVHYEVKLDPGTPRVYRPEDKLDNRSAFGNALADIGRANVGVEGRTPIAVFDCDLASSVKVDGFAKEFPENFFEAGVQEHNTATVAGALSSQGVLAVWGDFGVFNIDETYNQQRLNDINRTNLKVASTHLGIDVGEDGKTHHCVDYIGVLRNLYGFRLIVPADPNQTDRATRYMLTRSGNYALGVGRSRTPIITREDGSPFFDADYRFEYGKADILRDGDRGALIVYGQTAWRGVRVWEMLREKGISIMVINMASVLDPDLDLLKRASETGYIAVYEDHNVKSGLGSIIADILLERGWTARFRKFGLTDYAPSGKAEDLFEFMGLSPERVAEEILSDLE
ncbi:MAG: transketolase [Candidatus Hydrothermota bacterium]|nr:MAG: transketolase [Candidatus Hydrothermae bacterium]